jgi:hypothetical protein
VDRLGKETSLNFRPALRSVVTLGLAAGVVLPLGCNSRWFRQAAGVVGEEAAYAALRSALVASKVQSADGFVDAVRMVVDRKDYGGGAAAFAVALNLHNARVAQKYTADQMISLMRLSEPVVRRASPRVGDGLRSFCDYVGSH